MNIEHKDGIEFLKSLQDNSVDLIITDPPYLISKETGMNKFEKEVQKIEKSGENKKTLECDTGNTEIEDTNNRRI